jgi:hypothetical protein
VAASVFPLVGKGLGRWVAAPGEQARRTQSAAALARRDLTSLDTTIRGAVRLLGGPWELHIRPERGGRITSLRLAGEELLDQGIGVDDPSADGFVAAGAWGWDEMVPNVDAARYPGPGPFEGVELPDHGEAWRLPWTVVDGSTLECRGRVLPWTLTRGIVLTDSAVRMTYTYTNAGDAPLYAYWCAHPLFRYEDDMDVEVGRELTRPGVGESRKVFLRRGALDRAFLRWKSGAAVEMAWDSSVAPYVGVWLCNGDLGGYRQIAIEPATGGGDRPHLAVPPPLLAPGEQLSWWLEVKDARSA